MAAAATYRWMLAELEFNRLTVCKVGYLRVVCSVNCQWYRDFCAAHVRCRKRRRDPETIIKRRETILALKRVIAGNTSGVYAGRLAEAADQLEKT